MAKGKSPPTKLDTPTKRTRSSASIATRISQGLGYVSIFVKNESDLLLKHMDHLNNTHRGYEDSIVYSYLENSHSICYRVTFVMTFRRSVGSVVSKMHATEKLIK